MTNTKNIVGISMFALVMLITISIDSIRNMPATALFGPALIFFFIFSAITFLIPTALVSAELAAAWPNHSGVFHWVRLAFNEKIALVAIWLQWINTMVWYPTILSFLAGTLATLIDPALAQNKIYMVSMILSSFWLLTLINLKGVQVSAKFASFCAIFGMMIPMAFIIILASVWIFLGKPSQVQFTAQNMLPSFSHSDSWISLTAIMTSFLGIELAAVHVRDVDNPRKTFPKALFYSAIFILVTMIGGSLAIAIVLPANQINLVNGITEAFSNFLSVYHLTWLLPIVTIMIFVGSFGSVINWIISPAKGLLQAGQYGHLPPLLQKENKHGVASNLLILQAILVSVVCLAFLLMPSVNGSYWLLTDLSTQVYMLMYVMMFAAALVLRYKYPAQIRPFSVPGGNIGMWLIVVAGLFGCIITLIVGFFPPSGINVGGTLHYEIVFTGGILAMVLPVLLFFKKRYTSIAENTFKD